VGSDSKFRIRAAQHVPFSLAGAIILIFSLTGCARLADQPELNPARFAPSSVDRQWQPNAEITRHFRTLDIEKAPASEPASAPQPRRYDLSALIDIALRNNPHTQAQWQMARAAAARYGSSRAPYYPRASAFSSNGYTRTPFQLPGAVSDIAQYQAEPTAELTYTLLDFGRRRSASEIARDQLIAANFAFNRAIQDVVFATQSAFYSFDAARAGVTAAEQNLELARSDADAVQQRLSLGLATQPELLLARERVAQSEFDLANSRLLVHDAQANLAVALGIPANEDFEIETLQHLSVPESLGAEVGNFIEQARRERPDLAANMARFRAAQAGVTRARAEFYPTVQLSAGYGENLWDFTFKGPPTMRTGQPQYSALLTLRWDIFTGFKRLNDLRAARADRKAAFAQLKSVDIDAVAQVWRSYYEFESSLSKYQYSQSLLAASRESYDANLETYRQGLSTIVELLTAQSDLANARYTLIASKAQLLTAYASVAYAAGAIRTP
jgi:outer membrane protein